MSTTPQETPIPTPISHDLGVLKKFDPQRFVPDVIPITTENISRLSNTYMGLLKRDDGKVEITKQFLTKCQHPEIQLVVRHKEIPDKFPVGIQKLNHPPCTDIRLGWSHQGEWVKMPINRTEKLKANDDNYVVVRVESYIDEEGEIKKGVCYSKSASDLEVWFREEDFKVSHPFWEIPKVPEFFNQKVWKADVPYWNTSKGKTIKKRNLQ